MPNNPETLFSTPQHHHPHPGQVLMPSLGPWALPTDRQDSSMAPGSFRRNGIQVVSEMTDCEGARALP